MLIKIVAQTSRVLAVVIGLALVGQISYLVITQYRAQLTLQNAALQQLTSDSSRRATAVRYFIWERKDDLRVLSECREISAYFENKALGMSLEYGLRASLIMITEQFEKLAGSKLLGDRPIYERIVFIGASGEVLADTAKDGVPADPDAWRRYLTPDAQAPVLSVDRQRDDAKFVISTPVVFKGTYVGELVAWLSSARVYRYFVEGNGESSSFPVALVFGKSYLQQPARVKSILGVSASSIPADITPRVPYQIKNIDRDPADLRGYAILVPVEGTPLSLMTFLPPSEMFATHSPRRILYTTGGIALFILLGFFYLQRTNTHNAVLQVHLEETRLREAAVDEKNRLLAGEVEERRQVETALRESQQQLLNIIDFLPDATLVVGKDGRVLAWNRAMEVMTGVSAGDIIGKDNYEYALPFYGKRRPILIDLALNPGQCSQEVYASLRRDADVTFGEAYTDNLPNRGGRHSYLSATASVLRDSRGEVIAAIECIRDSTERLRAEQLVRDSEATLKSLMDSMPAGVWWYNQREEVEYLNGRFAELFGYRLDELRTVGDWFSFAYPDPGQRAAQQEARSALIAEARLLGMPVPPRETVVTCRDGNQRHVIVNTQFAQGRTLEIFTDVTEQEFIHNELLKVQKMESLGVLAGGIAHDFNNILTGIMGNISFAQVVLEESSEARLPLQAAEKASLRAAELAHQLLTFAKGGQPVKKVVSVGHLVGEAVSLSLRGTNVQARIELPEGLQHVEADPGQMNQAFNNIVINAAHAMPGGGTLTVTGANVELGKGNKLSLRPGSYVRLEFCDEGCGIAPRDMKNIFDPYFTTKSGGNGLGLASTLSVIRKHGGHILVDSKVGRGTTFTLYLPSTKETVVETKARQKVEVQRNSGESVLVMDDEEMLRTLSAQILSHLGYQVTTCCNGEEAIAGYVAAKQSGAPFFAVIMDLTVPGGMGGKEAAQHILAFDPTAKLVVSSGYSNDLALSDYSDFGFCGAVRKPYKVSELADTLEGLKTTV